MSPFNPNQQHVEGLRLALSRASQAGIGHEAITFLEQLLEEAKANEGVPATLVVPEGWMLVRIEHFEEIKRNTEDPSQEAYLGRNKFDEHKVYDNWKAVQDNLSSISDTVQCIERDQAGEDHPHVG